MVKLPANIAEKFTLSGVTSPREVLRNGQEVNWELVDLDTAEHIVKFKLSDALSKIEPVAPATESLQPPKSTKK
jgi:hypothetical protein